MQESLPTQQNNTVFANRYLGGTVLEKVATPIQAPNAGQPAPPPTPPVPFQTHTTSGEGMVRMNDDQDQEHLYE